jgi:hypothetical protein
MEVVILFYIYCLLKCFTFQVKKSTLQIIIYNEDTVESKTKIFFKDKKLTFKYTDVVILESFFFPYNVLLGIFFLMKVMTHLKICKNI